MHTSFASFFFFYFCILSVPSHYYVSIMSSSIPVYRLHFLVAHFIAGIAALHCRLSIQVSRI